MWALQEIKADASQITRRDLVSYEEFTIIPSHATLSCRLTTPLQIKKQKKDEKEKSHFYFFMQLGGGLGING